MKSFCPKLLLEVCKTPNPANPEMLELLPNSEIREAIFLRSCYTIFGDPLQPPIEAGLSWLTISMCTVTFRNIHFRCKIQVTAQAKLVAENCVFIPYNQKCECAVEIFANSKGELTSCHFSKAIKTGIAIRDRSSAQILKCKFYHNANTSILVLDNSRATIVDCKFKTANRFSIYLYRNSISEITNSKFKSQPGKALFMLSNSQARVKNCQFVDCQGGAISIADSSEVYVEQTEFQEIGNSSIHAMKNSTAEIKDSKFISCKGNGVNFEYSKGYVYECKFFDFEFPAIACFGQTCTPVIFNSIIDGCKTIGVVARDCAAPLFSGLEIKNILSHGFSISDFSKAYIKNCKLEEIGGSNFCIFNGANPVIEGCNIFTKKHKLLEVFTFGKVCFKKNKILLDQTPYLKNEANVAENENNNGNDAKTENTDENEDENKDKENKEKENKEKENKEKENKDKDKENNVNENKEDENGDSMFLSVRNFGMIERKTFVCNILCIKKNKDDDYDKKPLLISIDSNNKLGFSEDFQNDIENNNENDNNNGNDDSDDDNDSIESIDGLDNPNFDVEPTDSESSGSVCRYGSTGTTRSPTSNNIPARFQSNFAFNIKAIGQKNYNQPKRPGQSHSISRTNSESRPNVANDALRATLPRNSHPFQLEDIKNNNNTSVDNNNNNNNNNTNNNNNNNNNTLVDNNNNKFDGDNNCKDGPSNHKAKLLSPKTSPPASKIQTQAAPILLKEVPRSNNQTTQYNVNAPPPSQPLWATQQARPCFMNQGPQRLSRAKPPDDLPEPLDQVDLTKLSGIYNIINDNESSENGKTKDNESSENSKTKDNESSENSKTKDNESSENSKTIDNESNCCNTFCNSRCMKKGHCLKCKMEDAEFVCVPCGHKVLCKMCADEVTPPPSLTPGGPILTSASAQRSKCPLCETPIQKCTEEFVEETCVICLDNMCDTVILPCGHRCICYECAVQLWTEKKMCPLCQCRLISFRHMFPIY